jgi:UDPglucose--hexose-1-phosphate uridylyltransferase
MPELRKDPVSGHWVIIAREKMKKPADLVSTPTSSKDKFCPFDYGNEDKTPPEILAYRPSSTAPNGEGWQLRVVPNKFPVLKVESDLDARGIGLYDMMGGVGAHEVIIETPDHEARLKDFSAAQMVNLLKSFRDRISDLRRDGRLEYVLVFKNYGREAGARLDHSHSQLIALPVVPVRVADEIKSCEKYYDFKQRCLFCDIIRQELEDHSRLVDANSDFVVIEPFAPRSPFETWILPRRHLSHYDTITDMELENLSRCFRSLFKRLDLLLGDFSYNFILHMAPLRQAQMPHYHWHFEIIPNLTRLAGFEWGSGFYINPTPPEEAATFLREVSSEEMSKL